MAKRKRRPRRASTSRRRRRPTVLMINPRRRRHSRRRRNPGFSVGSIVKDVGKVLVPGALAAGAMGFIDAKFLGDKALLFQVLAKLGLAGAAGYFLRKKQSAAYAAMGAILGGVTYPMGLRAGGGVVAAGKIQGMRELAALASGDQHAMGLLAANLEGMGAVVEEGMGDMPDLDDSEGDTETEEILNQL